MGKLTLAVEALKVMGLSPKKRRRESGRKWQKIDM